MNKIDYHFQILNHILPYFRDNEDIKAILYAIAERFENLQDIIGYLLDALEISDARGIWLDFAGKEVGAEREEIDLGSYFCVNALHVNKPRRFFFVSSGENPYNKITLEDAEFIQKIMSVIASNISNATHNENIEIIKTITNARNVIMKIVAPAVYSINIYGNNLTITGNTVKFIQDILATGVYTSEVIFNAETN